MVSSARIGHLQFTQKLQFTERDIDRVRPDHNSKMAVKKQFLDLDSPQSFPNFWVNGKQPDISKPHLDPRPCLPKQA